MATTETFDVSGWGGRRSPDTWGTVREDSSAGGDAWHRRRRGAPDWPPPEVTR